MYTGVRVSRSVATLLAIVVVVALAASTTLGILYGKSHRQSGVARQLAGTVGSDALNRVHDLIPSVLRPLLTAKERKWIAQFRLAPLHTPFSSAARRYLRHHRVWLSCTTSPTRLPALVGLLQLLRLDGVSGIFVTLPKIYRPTKQPYAAADVQRLEAQVPLARVVRCEEDWGPICKLAPALERVHDEDDTVITIDDDTLLPPDAVPRLINASVAWDGAYVVANIGQNWIHWDIVPPRQLVHLPPVTERPPPVAPAREQADRVAEKSRVYQTKVERHFLRQPKFVDVAEGFGSVAYRRRHCDPAALKSLASLSRATRLSDDMVLSLHLEDRRVPRVCLQTPHNALQLAYGYGADALHARYDNAKKYAKTVTDVAAAASGPSRRV